MEKPDSGPMQMWPWIRDARVDSAKNLRFFWTLTWRQCQVKFLTCKISDFTPCIHAHSSRDEPGSGLDRTGSGLKPVLAGSGLDRTAIFLKIGGSGPDRTEKIFVVLM